MGLQVIGVGYVCVYSGWHVCARAGGLYESVVLEGVEEGGGEGEVDNGSLGLVGLYVLSFANFREACKMKV